MYCKHLAAEMGPLQPGEEVEMAELPAGTCGMFVLYDDVPGSHQWIT